ncbi:hypothetical protein H310_05318 [Aphanomyces invadans]|uniref:Uncharacterized protein n=1 Tax=Aphanomyces invadans TaxID=157072 RepID=A0A024UB36_9STRA|nr:hypothetical protein H310_05318 [Aphanomyces invadans]ETW02838.1 hypothetical protein H310_05318 [Aphanomyces invadans]|eukprot:XP_008868222.1 hypothetical protein H310_05318 [Aphanomyces invadans]
MQSKPNTVAFVEQALNMPLSARHVVVFSELSPEQKQNYTKFIIEHNVKFGRNPDGLYVATVSLGSAHFSRAAEEARTQTKQQPLSVEELDHAVQEMPPSMKRYATLYFLLESLPVEPSKTGLSDIHLAKTIHDIYDARWEDVRRDHAPSLATPCGQASSFATFVVHHFQTRFGLAKLVAQNAIDLMLALHANKHRLDTEIFSCFLDGTYCDDALEFYLFARHEIVVLLTKDTLGGKVNLSKDSTWISKAQCLVAANAVFGSRLDPNYAVFLRKLKRHLTMQPASRANTHIIEMNEFLLLVLETFQAARVAEEPSELAVTTSATKTLETSAIITPKLQQGDERQRFEALLQRVRTRQLENASSDGALSPKNGAVVWLSSPT